MRTTCPILREGAVKYAREDWLKEPSGVIPFAMWLNEGLPVDRLRDALITSGFFVVVYEHLYYVVVRKLLELHETGGDGEWIYVSDDYEREVLALDPEGKKRRFESSLEWLAHRGVLDRQNITEMQDIRTARHELAHNLTELLPSFDSGRYTRLFKEMVRLLEKVDTWWTREFDLPVSWAAAGHEGEPVLSSVRSVQASFLGLIYDLVLEHDPLSERRLEALLHSARDRDGS